MDYYNNLGSALASMGRYEKAEKAWRYILSKEPMHEEAEKNLKRLQSLRKHYGTKAIPTEESLKFSSKP
jgi:tetratricopeptide (TPR) repeat protein